MARSQLISITIFLFILLTIQSTSANQPVPQSPKPVEKIADVAVEGIVYCQSCDSYGSWSLTGAKPIEAAIISVICKDHRNRVSYYKVCKTDKSGYFYAQLKGFKMSHSFLDHPLQACKVKLVSSPLKKCNSLSNVNYGLYGAPLRYENKKVMGSDYEAIIYAAGPLAFHPAYCAPKIET